MFRPANPFAAGERVPAPGNEEEAFRMLTMPDAAYAPLVPPAVFKVKPLFTLVPPSGMLASPIGAPPDSSAALPSAGPAAAAASFVVSVPASTAVDCEDTEPTCGIVTPPPVRLLSRPPLAREAEVFDILPKARPPPLLSSGEVRGGTPELLIIRLLASNGLL